MKEIEIKDISGKTRFLTPINKGAKGKFTLMKEDYILLPFSVPEPIYFKLGDYVDLSGILDDSLGGLLAKVYELVDIQKPVFNTSTGGYDYSLRLDAYYWKWKNKKFKYTPEHAGYEASWSLTAPLDVHLGVLLRNLKALGYTYKGKAFEFSIDSTVANKAVAMTYDNVSLLDALFSMASREHWNCDCWITDNIIHFGRNEYGDAVKIELGFEASLMACNESKGKYASRIYAFGSTRNIPQNYRHIDEQTVVNGVVQHRLMLPADTPCIEVYPNMPEEEAVEDIVVFDDVYPRRIGTLSNVETVNRKMENPGEGEVGTFKAYQYKDTGLVFENEYKIEGQNLEVIFQSGKLNGLKFGVIFEPEGTSKGSQIWEIRANEDYGRLLPDEVIYPENGDTYILLGFNIQLVSAQYIPEAEKELKDKAQKYAEQCQKDDGTYSVILDSTWVYEDKLKRFFEFGQKTNLINKAFFENGRESRILGWEFNLDIPWDNPCYIMGESIPYSRMSEIEDKVESLTYKGQTYIGGGGTGVYIVRTNDSTTPSDNNVFSARQSLRKFLCKDRPDQTEFLLRLLGGAVFGENKATITSEGRGILRELLVEVQAEINRLLVSAGAEVRNGLLADLITVQNGLLQTIISPEGIRTATAAVTGLQAETINNDGESAVLHGNKADFKGPVGSKSYSPGTEGVGWNVDPHGNAWFNSIHLRGFLDVPELRHNRVTVITDEQWSAPGGGIIESADTEALILTLKLEEGEAAALEVDDICKGIFHSGAGFSTCFFRITEVLGESTFRYTLRSGYAMHPMTAMDFVAYGNFTNPDRQKSAYTTREYTRYLKDVNDWDITERNIVMMMGNLDGMRLNGMDMSGYSAFLRNIYMTGTIRQMSGDGVTETLVPAWKGEWKAGTYYKNDEVTHNGATWLCISDEPTTQEPSITVTDWLQTVSEGKDAVVVSVYSTNGLFFQNGQGETELYAVVRQGDADITSSLPAGRFSWQRSSRNTDADALWNRTHEGLGPRIRITPYDVEGRSNFDCIVTI